MSTSRQKFYRDRDSSSEGEPVTLPSPGVTSTDGLNLGLEAKEGNGWLRNKVAPAMCYGIGTVGLIAVGLPVLISTPAVGVAGIAAHSVTAGTMGHYAFIIFCSGAGAAFNMAIHPWMRTKMGVPDEGLWYRFVGKKSSCKVGRNGRSEE
ncbi:hypothetical protein RB213_001899 [Colletotrichum asianum]